jgi:hypothetical protein
VPWEGGESLSSGINSGLCDVGSDFEALREWLDEHGDLGVR